MRLCIVLCKNPQHPLLGKWQACGGHKLSAVLVFLFHLNSSLLLYNQAIYEFYACYRLCYVSLSRPTTLTRSWNG